MADSGRAYEAKGHMVLIVSAHPEPHPPLALRRKIYVKTYSVVMAFVGLELDSLVRFTPFFPKLCESWEHGLHFCFLTREKRYGALLVAP